MSPEWRGRPCLASRAGPMLNLADELASFISDLAKLEGVR
jgi:hypothetical protein